MSNLNVTNIQHESAAGNNLILAADGTTTIPGGTNRPQIVGYQQGTFLPTITSTSGVSVWMTNGENVNDNTWEYSSFTWSRIGQQVTVNVYFRAKVAGNPSDVSMFCIKRYPYKSRISTLDNYHQNIAPVYCPAAISPATSYPNMWAATIWLPENIPGGDLSLYPGDQSIFYLTNPSVAAANVQASYIQANAQLIYKSVYFTDDTTWQPINGATFDT